jgi:hypothetical protein
MNTALYVLADEYLVAAQHLADLDLDEQTIADTLEGLAGAVEVKATNVAMFVRNLESAADQIKQAETAMMQRRKAIENRAERVKAYLKAQMERTGITKVDSAYLSIAIKNNPPAVCIDAESQIPAQFMRTPPPPAQVPDKKAIAEAIKAGQEVAGAHLERGTRLDIK